MEVLLIISRLKKGTEMLQWILRVKMKKKRRSGPTGAATGVNTVVAFGSS